MHKHHIQNELYLHEMNWVIFHLSRLIAQFKLRYSYDNFQNEDELDFSGTSRYKSGAPNENIVQNYLNIALLNVF